MSQTKKRKSDVQIEHENPKKEKWYNEEQKVKMLSAPLEHTQNTGRRSSFTSALHNMKRYFSGSAMKDKTRSTSKLPAAQLSSGQTANNKENDHSFASETSQESDHIPADKLVNNCGLRQFVQTGEAPVQMEEMDVTSSETFDTFDSSSTATMSSSVMSMVTPCRTFRRDHVRRSSVRSMPETPSTIDALALSAVRRHASVSSATDQKLNSPASSSRRSRISFPFFRARQTVDSSEKRTLNTSFAPLAEADESQEMNTVDPVTPEALPPAISKDSTFGRAASKFFGSGGKKRTSIVTPNEIFSVSMKATGADECATPTNDTSKTVSPGSSGIQKKVSKAINMFGFKTTPSPGRRSRVERSRTENPKKDHRIKKRTEINNTRRSSLAPGGLNMSLVETLNVQEKEKERALADLFRNKVRLSSKPIPDVLKTTEFDAILVDLIDGKPASSAARTVLNFYSAVEEVKQICDADMDKKQVVYKKKGQPFLICVKLDSREMKPLPARVRIGVGSGLREAWEQKTIKRVLAYPMFCFDEEEWNNVEDCMQPFFSLVSHALEWNKTPENIECVALAGLSSAHAQLLKEQFHHYLSKLPSSDMQMADI